MKEGMANGVAILFYSSLYYIYILIENVFSIDCNIDSFVL